MSDCRAALLHLPSSDTFAVCGIASKLLLSLATWGLFAAIAANAATINFDDIDASAGDVILTSYQGYNWTNISVYTNTPGFPGYNNGIVSAPNGAYTAGDAFGSPIISTITSSSPFNFISGYFGSGWYDGMSVTFKGLYNGAQDFSQTFTVNTASPQLFTLHFTNITELDIYSTITGSSTDPYGCGASGCSQVTLDDLTLTSGTAPPASSPEPMSLLLTALGSSGLAVFYRVKRSRTLK